MKRLVKNEKKFWSDIKHISWLTKTMIKSFLCGDMEGVRESWCWIKIHWYYTSTKLK